MIIYIFIALASMPVTSSTSIRLRRQSSAVDELCLDKNVGEYFRLPLENDCKFVVQCSTHGLRSVRCPYGLYFDIVKQTCKLERSVKNCDVLQKPKLATPRILTGETVCGPGKFPCGDQTCLERQFFCDHMKDCPDGSDENNCPPDKESK